MLAETQPGVDPALAARVLALHDEAWPRLKAKRWPLERLWFQTLLFWHGNQWLTWDETRHVFRRRKLATWVPMPVRNRLGSTAERLTATLSRLEPNWTFVPASESESDLAAAQVAASLEAIIAEENGLAGLREQVAKWLVATGSAFLFSGAEHTSADPPPMDEMDLLMGLQPPTPTYKLYTEVLSPFEVFADLALPNVTDQSLIILAQRKAPSWVKRTFGIDAEPDTSDTGLNYLDRLGYLSPVSDTFGRGLGSADDTPRHVTVKRLLIAPTEEFPSGAVAVVVNEQVVEITDWLTTPDGTPCHPLVDVKFDAMPGAFFGRTPTFDLLSPQETLNQLASLIQLIITRMGSPIWLVSSQTKVKNWTGDPGGILEYDALSPNAGKPDRLPGEQIPASILSWVESVEREFEELGSTFDAMKGRTPYAGAPGVVVDQLVEQGYTRFGPAFRGIAESWRRWMVYQLELFRQYATTPRSFPNLGENAQWSVKQFDRSNIRGALTLRVESDSTVPRSDSAEVSKMMAILNTGMLDLTDPLVKRVFLKKVHLTAFTKDLDEDVIDAVHEHDLLLQAGKQGATPDMLVGGLRVLPTIHNHPVHVARHRRFALSEEGRQFIPVMEAHIAEHMQAMAMQAMMMAPPGPGGPGAGGPQPMGPTSTAMDRMVGSAMSPPPEGMA